MSGRPETEPSTGIPPDVLHHEQAEIDYCREWMEAATPEIAAAGGLSHTTSGGVFVSIASRLDFLSLNRALGVGIEEPATEALLEEIVARYRAAGVPRFFLTVCSHSRSTELDEWLDSRLRRRAAARRLRSGRPDLGRPRGCASPWRRPPAAA